MNSAETPKPPRPPGPSLRVAVLLMVAGAALAIPTMIAAILPIVRAVAQPIRFDTGETVHVRLGEGTYVLYEDTGSSALGSPFSPNDDITIAPADVTISGPDNASVEVFGRGDIHESLSSGDNRFVEAVRFKTPASGEYTVTVRGPQQKALLIARPLTDTVASVLGWFALTGLGGVTLIVGIVLLIVGSIRRNKVRSAFAYQYQVPVAVPPGWHPDPWGSGRLRYWDGTRWTEHVQ